MSGPVASASPGSRLECRPPAHPTPADPGFLGSLSFKEAPAPGILQPLRLKGTAQEQDSWASGLQPPQQMSLLVLRWLARVQHRPQLRHSCPPGARPRPAGTRGSSGELYSRRLRAHPTGGSLYRWKRGGSGQILAALNHTTVASMVPTRHANLALPTPERRGLFLPRHTIDASCSPPVARRLY